MKTVSPRLHGNGALREPLPGLAMPRVIIIGHLAGNVVSNMVSALPVRDNRFLAIMFACGHHGPDLAPYQRRPNGADRLSGSGIDPANLIQSIIAAASIMR